MTSAKSKKRVFLVDDHALVREWLGNLINQRADLMTCGEATTAEEAMDAVATAKPDVVIVDLTLKDSFGVALIKDLKKEYPNIAILVLSMHEDVLYVERALRNGAKGYITKREATKNVIDAIYRVLEGKLYLSQALAGAMTFHYLEGISAETIPSVQLFSDRELEVFRLLGQGHGSAKIAEMLQISIKTVQAHCAHMQDKLHLGSSRELLREALRWYEASKTA